MRRHFATINSTNEAARLWARDESAPAPHGAFVSANEQTGGRGRRGREWVSPSGKGVYLSVVWRSGCAPSQVGRLTIVVALAAARAIEELSGIMAQTKWPNDILLRGRKVGGVLCEAELENMAVAFVVAGVGLNVNFTSEDLPDRPIFPASSLLLESGREFDVEAAREVLIARLEHEYARYESGQWNTQRGEFIARCAIIGEVVTIKGEQREYSAVATGIDEDGLLTVQTEHGLQSVAAGDVTFSV